MVCELCGKEVTFCKKVTIEGVLLEVCAECSRFGAEAKQGQTAGPVGPKPLIEQRLEVRARRAIPKDVYTESEGVILVDDYPKRVRDARSSNGISQKDLARKINEKQTVISKIESGAMRPDEKMIKKLQKELGVVLKEKALTVSGQTTSVHSSPKGVTLADLVKMQKK